MFGMVEATELSNLDDASATQPNNPRIQAAIEDATIWLNGYVGVANVSRRMIGIVARYFLDTLRTRENVKYDYEQIVAEIERIRKIRLGGKDVDYSGAHISIVHMRYPRYAV